MAASDKRIDKILGLPATKQVVAILLIGISTLSGVCAVLFNMYRVAKNETHEVERQCSRDKILMAQNYQSRDSAERSAEKIRIIEDFNRQLENSRREQIAAQERFDKMVLSFERKAYRIQDFSTRQRKAAAKIQQP